MNDHSRQPNDESAAADSAGSNGGPQQNQQARNVAYIAPFATFMIFLAVPDLLQWIGLDAKEEGASWYVSTPQLWIYPVQCLCCLGVLIHYRRHYELQRPVGLALAISAACLGIGLWILPGWIFEQQDLSNGWWKYVGLADRSSGFNPATVAKPGSLAYAAILVVRFLRLVVVVPLIEEIFWRGFLMRLLVDPDGDYWQVPFGTHHLRGLIGTTLIFTLVHSSVDYAGAIVYGLLAYAIAVRTRSLSSCVLMHAVANLLLGLYVLNSGQWGYW